jgi:iron(III) transport system substrate-binding protein
MVYPTEGVFIVSSPTAIIKGARNPNAAKLFAQFMISPLAQKMIADGGVHAARIDIAPPPGQPALSEMKFIPVDLDLIEGAGTGAQNQVCGYISVTPPRGGRFGAITAGVCACD